MKAGLIFMDWDVKKCKKSKNKSQPFLARLHGPHHQHRSRKFVLLGGEKKISRSKLQVVKMRISYTFSDLRQT